MNLILNLIESVSEDVPTNSYLFSTLNDKQKQNGKQTGKILRIWQMAIDQRTQHLVTLKNDNRRTAFDKLVTDYWKIMRDAYISLN